MHLLLLWKNALQRLKRLSGRISFFEVVPKHISFKIYFFCIIYSFNTIHYINGIIENKTGFVRILVIH